MMRPLSRPRLNGWRVRPREQRTILLIGDLLVSVLAQPGPAGGGGRFLLRSHRGGAKRDQCGQCRRLH